MNGLINHDIILQTLMPTWDRRWKEGLSTDTDNGNLGVEIIKYRIKMFNGFIEKSVFRSKSPLLPFALAIGMLLAKIAFCNT